MKAAREDARDNQSDPKEMPILEHLEELRRVMIDSLIAIGIGLTLAWAVSARVLELVITHSMPAGMPVVFLGPAEAFSARIKVALSSAVLLAAPFLCWRVWRFVVPGLLEQERTFVLPTVVLSTILFYVGGAFGFLVLVPAIMHVLLGFSTSHLTPNIAVGHLLGFVLQLSLACGVLFQLPLITTLLTVAGVVSPQWLWSRWRLAVLIIFVVAAGITPGDGPTVFLLGIPVSLLYLASVGLSFVVWGRRRAGRAPRDESADRPVPDGTVPGEAPSEGP